MVWLVLGLSLAAATVTQTVQLDVDPRSARVEVRSSVSPPGTSVALPADPAAPPAGTLDAPLYYATYPGSPEQAVIRGTPERFVIELPQRFGTFGCVEELCTMVGGFHPRVEGVTPEVAVTARHGRAFVSGDVVVVGTGLHTEVGENGWIWIGRGSGEHALAVAARSGVPGGTLVEVPLRDQLALRRGDVVLVSDRIFRIAPALFSYHERALRHALGAPPPSVADLGTRYAAWAVIPAVDRTLYVQQVGFAEAYFFEPPAPHWKLVYRNFDAVFTPATLRAQGSLDLALRKSDDLANSLRFGVFHDAAQLIGGYLTGVRGFGAPADKDRLAGAGELMLAAAELDAAFGSAGVGGESLSVTAGASWDDRAWVVEPWRYVGASLHGTWRGVMLDGAPAAHQGIATATLQGAVPLRPALIAAGFVRGAATVGEIVSPTQMLQAGGPTRLRAFAPDDLLGRTVVFGRVELRQTLSWNADRRLGSVASLRGFGVGAFWEAAVIGACADPGRQHARQDAGVTGRALFDWVGLAPSTLELDLVWAFARPAHDCLGRTVAAAPPDRAPTVLVRFGPSF